MNNYHITIFFSDKINFETIIKSSLDLNEFIIEINKKFNAKDNIFINFISEDTKYSVNRNKVLFYTIESVGE